MCSLTFGTIISMNIASDLFAVADHESSDMIGRMLVQNERPVYE